MAQSDSPADVKRQALVEHVHTIARRLAVQRGLQITMDDIAEAVGTSRSTLFRLFTSREKLLSDAFMAGINDFAQALPVYAGDLDQWLVDTCATAHRLNASFGPGYWELTSRRDLPPELAAAERRRAAARRVVMVEIARTLWQASGNSGQVPTALVVSVATHLSAHFTAAVMADARGSAALAAQLAEQALHVAVSVSVVTQ